MKQLHTQIENITVSPHPLWKCHRHNLYTLTIHGIRVASVEYFPTDSYYRGYVLATYSLGFSGTIPLEQVLHKITKIVMTNLSGMLEVLQQNVS